MLTNGSANNASGTLIYARLRRAWGRVITGPRREKKASRAGEIIRFEKREGNAHNFELRATRQVLWLFLDVTFFLSFVGFHVLIIAGLR